MPRDRTRAPDPAARGARAPLRGVPWSGVPGSAGVAGSGVRPRRRALGALLALVLLPAACAARYPVDGERALGRVVHQVEAGPRVPGMPGHRAIRDWLAGELQRLGGAVE